MASPARIHCAQALAVGETIALPESGARHVQVLRLQPGDQVTLFGNAAARPQAGASVPGEFTARITRMGRQSVEVHVESHRPIERESRRVLHLAVGMPANERMDWLVEKATELGAASIQPLMTERTVVRLEAERAARRVQHWAAIAIAACEQCGRNHVPPILPPSTFSNWVERLGAISGTERWVLSIRPQAELLAQRARPSASDAGSVIVLCGPEGGLSQAEEERATEHGFVAASLGPRVLRAETAALAALTLLG